MEIWRTNEEGKDGGRREKGEVRERNNKSGGSQALYLSLLLQDFVG